MRSAVPGRVPCQGRSSDCVQQRCPPYVSVSGRQNSHSQVLAGRLLYIMLPSYCTCGWLCISCISPRLWLALSREPHPTEDTLGSSSRLSISTLWIRSSMAYSPSDCFNTNAINSPLVTLCHLPRRTILHSDFPAHAVSAALVADSTMRIPSASVQLQACMSWVPSDERAADTKKATYLQLEELRASVLTRDAYGAKFPRWHFALQWLSLHCRFRSA